jgi:hypothetical protein
MSQVNKTVIFYFKDLKLTIFGRVYISDNGQLRPKHVIQYVKDENKCCT